MTMIRRKKEIRIVGNDKREIPFCFEKKVNEMERQNDCIKKQVAIVSVSDRGKKVAVERKRALRPSGLYSVGRS